MKLILLGAPGAGKGTQAEILCKELGIPTISTGNILRAAMREGTPLGREVSETMNRGELVRDDLVIELLTRRVQEEDCANGYILDGVPRTTAQAEALEKVGIQIDAVLSFEIADELIVERMEGRRVCEQCGASYHVTAVPPKVSGVCDKCGGNLIQRPDDKAETVKNRLSIYHQKTEPLKAYYAQRGLLKTVENQPTVAETTSVILRALGRD